MQIFTFEEGGIIKIIPSCLKITFEEGGIIKIISTFVYFIKPKRCDRIKIISRRKVRPLASASAGHVSANHRRKIRLFISFKLFLIIFELNGTFNT